MSTATKDVWLTRHGETEWSRNGPHARARAAPGNVAVFAHGHLLRVLAVRWLGWPVAAGRHFPLDTGTVNVLSAYWEAPAIKRWNAPA